MSKLGDLDLEAIRLEGDIAETSVQYLVVLDKSPVHHVSQEYESYLTDLSIK